MKKESMIAYTDGSSRGNPGPGGWGVVAVLHDTVIEKGGGEKETTNNRMELRAAIEALGAFGDTVGDVEIHTDSQYVKRGITLWVHGWEKNGWKTKTKNDVLNKELWQQLAGEEEKRKLYGKVSWHYVAGHVGHGGNERADVIATMCADDKDPGLYEGPRDGYRVDLSESGTIPEAVAKKSRSKTKAYSYLSFLDGVAMRHATWAECEARVKGTPARYKKAVSSEDEAKILAEWGAIL